MQTPLCKYTGSTHDEENQTAESPDEFNSSRQDVGPSVHESVSDTANGLDISTAIAKLLTHFLDVSIDGPRSDDHIVAPDFLD
jgi:hypothetical protein